MVDPIVQEQIVKIKNVTPITVQVRFDYGWSHDDEGEHWLLSLL